MSNHPGINGQEFKIILDKDWFKKDLITYSMKEIHEGTFIRKKRSLVSRLIKWAAYCIQETFRK